MLNQTVIKIKERANQEKADGFYIGPQGERGPQGIRGAIGVIGEDGDKGDTGPDGASGYMGKDATGILEVKFEEAEASLYYYYAVDSILSIPTEEDPLPIFYSPLNFNAIKEIEKPIVRIYICNDVYILYKLGGVIDNNFKLPEKIITLPDENVINLGYKQIVEIVYLKKEDKWLTTIINI